jgi:molybdate transport system substrate-binding protein
LTAERAEAEQGLAAVASNFTTAMERIAAHFNAKSGHRVVVSYGATGKFYAQIKHGAPFDVFLAADSKHPALLEQERLTVPGTRFTYAVGRLALWSARPGDVDDPGAILKTGDFKHLAIANPKTAPYGEAARTVLQRLGVWERIRPRLVMGENIAQTYQFVATGNAELGFVALAQLIEGAQQGSYWLVPQELHRPLVQQAVLLQHGQDNAAARALLEFLKGDEARTLIEALGYTRE